MHGKNERLNRTGEERKRSIVAPALSRAIPMQRCVLVFLFVAVALGRNVPASFHSVPRTPGMSPLAALDIYLRSIEGRKFDR